MTDLQTYLDAVHAELAEAPPDPAEGTYEREHVARLVADPGYREQHRQEVIAGHAEDCGCVPCGTHRIADRVAARLA